jgi:hypothetical protein
VPLLILQIPPGNAVKPLLNATFSNFRHRAWRNPVLGDGIPTACCFDCNRIFLSFSSQLPISLCVVIGYQRRQPTPAQCAVAEPDQDGRADADEQEQIEIVGCSADSALVDEYERG